jgi:Tfp pilus assembly protein FimT
MLELLIVLTLIALVTGISYPSAAAGVESESIATVVSEELSGYTGE